MAYIEVDVELDEFDTSDLIAELKSRIKVTGRKKLEEHHIKAMIETSKEVLLEFDKKPVPKIDALSLDDVLKLEHLQSVIGKYCLCEIQNRLP